jgi:hypothetical protein
MATRAGAKLDEAVPITIKLETTGTTPDSATSSSAPMPTTTDAALISPH